MLHVTKPDKRRRGKRYFLINPPIEEPYRARLDDAARQDGDGPGSARPHYTGRSYTYPLPIGLLRIANQLLREGNEIYFLDCFSALPLPYPSSRSRRTRSEDPDFMLTDSHNVRYFHLGLTYEEIRKILRNVNADEVFVGCTFTYHNEPAHKVIELCKERMPKVRLTFGGIYPTLAPEVARTSLADEIFAGSYPGIEDLSLNYDFLGAPPAFILTKGTSGCPHRCAYCAVHKLEGNRFTHRDPEDVFQEILGAHQRYGLIEVAMWDSNILMRYNNYLGVILRHIIDAGLKFRMAAPEGLDYRLMTPEIAHDLKQAGFRIISLALENADSDYAREHLNRQNVIGQLKNAISFLKDAGFAGHQVHLFVIVGLPGQTIENIIRNVRFVWSLGCNVILFPFTPIPGTAMYESSLEQLHGLPLKALHPSLYPCATDEQVKKILIELGPLGLLNRDDKAQATHFREVVDSEELIEMLS